MYTPKSAGEAKPFTLPLTAVKEMLYGRYATDQGRKSNQLWTQFMNVLGSIHVPENYWDTDPHIIANLDEADPHVIGRIGTIWLSPNFADIVREVYAVSMMRSIPTLPVSTFWANVEPNWVPKSISYPVRRLNTSMYWSISRSLDELVEIDPRISRVIISTAHPDVADGEVFIDYPTAGAEAAISQISAFCQVQEQPCMLQLGDLGSDQTFVTICSDPDLLASLLDACLAEVTGRQLSGIELGWQPQLLAHVTLFDQLVAQLSTRLAAVGKTLGFNVEGSPAVPYSPITLDRINWINLKLWGFGNPYSDIATVTEELTEFWLQVVDPIKLSMGVDCRGIDQRSGQPVSIGYRAIVDLFGLSAALVDQIGGQAPDDVSYNGVPTIQAKTRLARQLGLAGLTFAHQEDDTYDVSSLLTAAFDAAVNGESGQDDSLTVLAYSKGWSIVTGPCNWSSTTDAAIMLIDQTVPYAEGGRAFVDQTLATLGG